MMARVVILAAVMLVALARPASSEPRKQIGLGAHTCGTWTQERQAEVANGMRNWVIGFVNGANVYDSGPDFLLQTDPNAIVAWMDNYCRSNPLENIFTGAYLLVQELRSRAQK